MSNFLHVTLRKNAIFSEFGRLDGAGAYIPVPGGSAVVLKGFVAFIRVAEGISH